MYYHIILSKSLTNWGINQSLCYSYCWRRCCQRVIHYQIHFIKPKPMIARLLMILTLRYKLVQIIVYTRRRRVMVSYVARVGHWYGRLLCHLEEMQMSKDWLSKVAGKLQHFQLNRDYKSYSCLQNYCSYALTLRRARKRWCATSPNWL